LRAAAALRPALIMLAGILWLAPSLTATGASKSELQRDARSFLEAYNRLYQTLYTVSTEATWKSSTDVTPEHTGQRIGADHAFSSFVGSPFIIERIRYFLQHTNALDPITIRQLHTAYLDAAGSPGTIPQVVAARVTAEARQGATLDGFAFQWRPPGADKLMPTTANQIDEGLTTSTNLEERLALWKASKESGVALKPGLLELRDLRNKVAREMGFSSFFASRVANFDMTVPEMQALTDKLVNDTRPLYEQLHCWARYKLAAKYGQPVPKLIPAHWLGNRWSQEWPGLVDSIDLDPLFKGRKPEWIVQQAVAYGESLGLPKVPAGFWEKSDLYDLPADAKRRKNTHASAWSINLAEDVRSLQNVRADFNWFATAHHELGHVFYDLSYSRPEIPIVLRRGASPAFHEAMAETLATPAIQLPYLRQVGIVPASAQYDETQWLLNSALDQVVFIPWSAGVMRSWEQEFYEKDLPQDQLNAHWWKCVEKYQGVSAPEPRGENYCDAATKTHINDDPAEYYKYSIAFAIKYHLHMHIARKMLKQDPRNCNFYGNKEVGAFLYKIMKSGATKDWRVVIREATGEDLSAKAMLDYYQPVLDYLKKENAGRQLGW